MQGAGFIGCVELAGSQIPVRDDLLQTDWTPDSLLGEQLFWVLRGDGSDPQAP